MVKIIDPDKLNEPDTAVSPVVPAPSNSVRKVVNTKDLDKDAAFQAIVEEGVRIAAVERSELMLARWHIGRLVKQIQTGYGEGTIQTFCDKMKANGAADYSYKTVMKCKTFHEEIPEAQARDLANRGIAIRNIERALSPKIQPRERHRLLERAAAGEIDQDKLKASVESAIEKATQPEPPRNIGDIATDDTPTSVGGRDIDCPSYNDFMKFVCNLDGIVKKEAKLLREFEKLSDRYDVLDTKGRKAAEEPLNALKDRLSDLGTVAARAAHVIEDCLRA